MSWRLLKPEEKIKKGDRLLTSGGWVEVCDDVIGKIVAVIRCKLYKEMQKADCFTIKRKIKKFNWFKRIFRKE